MLEKSLQKYWTALGMEVELGPPHGHFLERVNDSRNGKQVSFCELQKIFIEVFHKYGQMIAQKHPNFEAVMTDLHTKLNVPFMLKLDPRTKKLELVAKTVMRKADFKSPDPKLAVEGKLMKNEKTFTQLREWLDTAAVPTVPSADWGSEDFTTTTDHAPFAVENQNILDKLNGYCHELSSGQFVNPYYPINKLWTKLSLIGINFDVKSVMFSGSIGTVRVPLNQFGGRYGVLGGPSYVSSDDGISNRLPGGLTLVISHTNIHGVYTLDAHIENGASTVGFGEEAVQVTETHQFTHRVYTGPTLVKDTAKRLHKTYPNVAAGTEHVMIHTNHPADHVLKSMKSIGSGWQAKDIHTKTHPEGALKKQVTNEETASPFENMKNKPYFHRKAVEAGYKWTGSENNGAYGKDHKKTYHNYSHPNGDTLALGHHVHSTDVDKLLKKK
jgi:hypothetical protein